MENHIYFEEQELDSLTEGHARYPIGYPKLTLGDKIQGGDFVHEDIINSPRLNQRELFFLESALELIKRERRPWVSRRAELLVKYLPEKYGFNGTNPIYRELNCKVNRDFTSAVKKLKGKKNIQ